MKQNSHPADKPPKHSPSSAHPPKAHPPKGQPPKAQRASSRRSNPLHFTAAEAEERYLALLSALTQMVWTTGPEGLAEHDIPAWCAYSGQTSKQARGWGWLDAIHPDDRERVSQVWNAAVAAHAPYEAEYRLRRADGVYRDFVTRAVPIFDDTGEVREWMGAGTDITDRKRFESTLWRTARQMTTRAGELEAILNAVSDALIVYDTTGAITRMNSATHTLLALDAEPAFMELPLAERMARLDVRDEHGAPLPEDAWPHVHMLRGQALSGARSPDMRIRALDGHELQVSVSGAPIRDERGYVTGAVAIFRDVTERRRLERHTHEALNALLAMAEAVVSSDDTGEVSSLRATAERLTDLTRKVLDCLRASIHALQSPEETMRPVAVCGMSEEMERAWWTEWEQQPRIDAIVDPDSLARLRAGEVLVFDLSRPPYDTQPNPYEIVTLLVAPMRVGEQLVGILALDHDRARHTYTSDELALAGAVAKLAALVIERERLLAEREAARASALALREANRHMDEFLSIASHELRNPLTGIRASIQLCERRLRKIPQQVAEEDIPLAEALATLLDPLHRGERQTGLLDRLVGDLLDVSRIQTGRLELRVASMDLAALVRDAVEQQRAAHPDRTIALHQPAGAVPVQADADRIGQVVTNYLTNALKYSPDDAPVEVRLALAGAAARISVRDQGPGLSQEQQTHIWERFHRVPGITASGGKGGLGLGLYISRGLIERHGGQVGVESAPGHGSTFWCTLPLSHQPA